MTAEEIKPGTLVIVVEIDQKPPRHCWGLVRKITPNGALIVQIGKEKDNTIILLPDQLIPILQTSGNCNGPEEAVEAHRSEILLENTLISHTAREIRALRRYKKLVEGTLRRRFAEKIRSWTRRV